jgi:hypothetical protein
MRKEMILTISLMLGISLSSIGAGPWVQGKGKGVFSLQSVLPISTYETMLMGSFLKEKQGVNRKTSIYH